MKVYEIESPHSNGASFFFTEASIPRMESEMSAEDWIVYQDFGFSIEKFAYFKLTQAKESREADRRNGWGEFCRH